MLLREGFYLWDEKGGVTVELLVDNDCEKQAYMSSFANKKQELQDITSLLHHCF